MPTPRATGAIIATVSHLLHLPIPVQNLLTVIGQYHLPQDPSLLLSPSFLLFCSFVCLFCCLISQNLKAFGCRERRRAAEVGWERAEGRQLPTDLVFWG